MMIFPWLALIGLIAAAIPSAIFLARRQDDSGFALIAVLTLAIASGALSLILFWESVIGISLTFNAVAFPYLVLMLPGIIVLFRTPPRFTRPHLNNRREGAALLLILLIAAAVLFNAIYYPLYADDTLGIYRPAALPIFYEGRIDPLIGAESLYRTYPILVPSLYALGYMASGWENDYLAKLIPALLSLGCLPAVYLLAKRLSGRTAAGWIAALLLAITPAFGRWASSGYVDLPMAFFYLLAAYYALRLSQQRTLHDARLAGVMIGLAVTTKNAALLGVPLLGAWLIFLLIQKRITLAHLLNSLAACALIGAPWYIRNLIGAGFIMPATAWTDQAQRTIANLLVFITRPENFGVAGVIVTIALVPLIVNLFRVRRATFTPALLIAGFALPFFAAWWLFVSYDPRFLLLFLPLLIAYAADRIAALQFHPRAARLIIPLAWVITAAAAGYTIFRSVDYKDELLRDPLMTHEEKLVLVGRAIPPESQSP